MNNTMQKILLKPISCLYGGIIAVWNRFYDLGICKSRNGVIPTISVGNITVGGTGKTPHTEYLLSLLADKIKTAYVSRGYLRQSKGFQIATSKSNASQIGDEAYQVKEKYDNVIVAVDANRHNALNKLNKLETKPKLVILDDAYQHRRLKPDLNILLIDYNRKIYKDHMLPYGELRESYKNTDRADIIIITKCSDNIKPVDCMSIRNRLNLYPYQSIYFTKITYNEPKSLFNHHKIDLEGKELLVITGIAQPKHFQEYIKKYSHRLSFMEFPDHHKFTETDIKEISELFDNLSHNNRAIVTTEKDAARLKTLEIPKLIKENISTIGIEIEFLFEGKSKFDEQINKFIKLKHIN